MDKPLRISHVEIGQRIRSQRVKLNLTQRSFTGISYAYMSRIETGTRRPSLEALVLIAQTLGTTGLQLLTGRRYSYCPLCERGKPHDGVIEMLNIPNRDGHHPTTVGLDQIRGAHGGQHAPTREGVR